MEPVRELPSLTLSCREAFGRVATLLDHRDADDVSLPVLRDAWARYYFAEFARFDQALKRRAEAGDPACPQFLPVSISHHNLHRLFEVLGREIGNGLLGSTRVPERIVDLRVVFERLSQLLDQLALTKQAKEAV